jgi:hypothetical protein
MGHTISTYHDIRMKGIEFLRGIYMASSLSIRPKTRVNKIDALKEIIRAWGLNPEEVLTREALSQPHRTVIDQSQLEQAQLAQLTTALKQQMLKEIRENQAEKSMNSRLGSSSPGEIRILGTTIFNVAFLKVDSFKRSSKIKSRPQFQVDFLPFYAQNERKLSEFNVLNMVRGTGFEPTQPTNRM